MDPYTTPRPASEPPPPPAPPPPYPVPAPTVAPAAWQQPVPAPGWRPKSKTTSVLLAVFLSYFTWVYTSERDAWKFWMNLGISALSGVLSVLTLGFWLFLAVPYWIGVWIWAIVDTARRPQEFYERYPSVG